MKRQEIQTRKRYLQVFTMTALAASMVTAQQAQAQAQSAAPKAELETVVVTAERKQENIKDVPVSATLMRSEQIDTIMASGQDIRVLAAKVPSLNIESSNGRTFPRFYIRGYGNTDYATYASQPVSLVYDDVVQENAVLKGFPMFDMENVEVLRGPQGTLFGRNTPAGVVKFNSVKPLIGATDGYVNMSAGTHGTTNIDGAVSVPLGQEWAARVSLLGQHRDDWVSINSADSTNLYNGDKTEGYNDVAGRAQLLYKPNASFNALFNVHARQLNGSARVFRANIIKQGTNDLVDGFDEDKVSTNGKNEQQLRTYGGSANLTWNLGDYSLYSITGYETIDKYFTRGDIDGGDNLTAPWQLETAGLVKSHMQLTQEFRIASQFAGPLSYQAGVYLFHEKVQAGDDGYDSASGALTSATGSEQKNDAWALFGSVNYDLTADLKLRGGLRYTHDKKSLELQEGYTPASKTITGNKVTGDVSATYKLSKETSVYVRGATGFRGASFSANTVDSGLTYADPETTISYEAGIKTDLFERRARLGFSVFRYDVKNQQLTAVGGADNTNTLINAEKTVGQGFEVDFEALITRQLRVSAGLSYNDTEIKDSGLSVPICSSYPACTVTDPTYVSGGSTYASINGNPLPQAPKWIANATARYSIPMGNANELYFFGDVAYRSKINLFLFESVEFTGKPLTELGLKAGYNWANGKYDASLFCRNCTNEIRVTGAINFNNLTGFINEPRTIGVQFRANFD
jgi:iron complex outermembrane recepter protein